MLGPENFAILGFNGYDIFVLPLRNQIGVVDVRELI